MSGISNDKPEGSLLKQLCLRNRITINKFTIQRLWGRDWFGRESLESSKVLITYAWLAGVNWSGINRSEVVESKRFWLKCSSAINHVYFIRSAKLIHNYYNSDYLLLIFAKLFCACAVFETVRKHDSLTIQDWRQHENTRLTVWQYKTDSLSIQVWQFDNTRLTVWWYKNDSLTIQNWQSDNTRLTVWQYRTDSLTIHDWQSYNTRLTVL